MQVRFWGTRGSLAKPGPSTVRYGGNTSCVEVRAKDGTLVVLDCGTGAHELGQALVGQTDGALRGSLLISHTHWDHIQGIPFFAPFFIPGNEWDIYAPQGFGETLRTTLAGQMEYTYFPIAAESFGATLHYHNVSEGEFRIGDTRILTRFLNHPALTIGYRIEADGASLVYACDHEPHSIIAALDSGALEGQDLLHSEFLRDADLVIHDAQYTAAEYPAKTGWGHSTIDYAVNVCARAGVRKLAFTHHDPMRSDEAVDQLLATARSLAGDAVDVLAAHEGLTIELVGHRRTTGPIANDRTAQRAMTGNRILVVTADQALFERIAEIAGDERLIVAQAMTGKEAISMLETELPPLIIADGNFRERIDAIVNGTVPVLIIGGNAAVGSGESVEHIHDGWTQEYLRSRIRTWLMRGKFAYVPAAIPEDEAQRLATLHEIQILDTPPEERFDRLTRIAARMFGVSIALVTLVDANRQWFKAKQGLETSETPRHMSFCAHAILREEPLIIPDALADHRFVNNPLVVGDPRVRFYAGIPLKVERQPIGTLCLIDSKPRAVSESDLQALRDLGAMAESELAASRSAGRFELTG